MVNEADRLRDIVIAYDDEPETELTVTVALGLDLMENDDAVFFYFKDEAEMRDAMNSGSGIDFRVISV
jgi:hypothetical protein